jgi:type IV pilus assembly protein PilE
MRGFSLIELLVTLAIVAVLAALALPGYTHVLNHALRQDARLALLRIQQQQETYFARHLHYASDIAGSAPTGLAMSPRSEQEHYVLELRTAADGLSYSAVASADPAGRQARDVPCMHFSLDETGHRRSADSSNHWRDDDLYRCWG